MQVYSKAISFVIDPISIVDISIYVPKGTFSVSLIIFPCALVTSSIFPRAFSYSMLHLIENITSVNLTFVAELSILNKLESFRNRYEFKFLKLLFERTLEL